MGNITKQKRDEMIRFLEELKAHILMMNRCEHLMKYRTILLKKIGLVFEEHTEAVDEMLIENIPVLRYKCI